MVVALEEHFVVGQRVVVEKETRGDVECNEYVDRIVLVRAEDEKQTEYVEHPCERVQRVHCTRRIFGDEMSE